MKFTCFDFYAMPSFIRMMNVSQSIVSQLCILPLPSIFQSKVIASRDFYFNFLF